MYKNLLSFVILAAGFSFTGVVSAAGSVASSIDVSATVISSCTVTTAGVNFAAYTGAGLQNSNGNITVNCTANTVYNIALQPNTVYGQLWPATASQVVPPDTYNGTVYVTVYY